MSDKIQKTEIFFLEDIIEAKSQFEEFSKHSNLYRGFVYGEIEKMPEQFRKHLYESIRIMGENHIHLLTILDMLNGYIDMILSIKENEKEQC